jgi:phytoene dehydrogenase-like protein
MTTSTDDLYDAIVVGAGPGGSAIAALLAKAGLHVLLVDKHAVPGGKMLTVQRDGFCYEMFPINAVPSRNSLFEELIRDLELEDEVQVIYPNPVGRFYFELSSGEIRTMDIPYKDPSPFGFKRLLGLSWIGFLKFLRIFAKMVSMKPDQLGSLASTSALDFIDRHNLPQSLKSYLLSVYTEGFFEAPADRVSAAAMVRAVQQTATFGGGRYYRGGMGSVFQGFARAVGRYGGTVLFKTRVERILVEQEGVTGIQAGGTRYGAPIVISNAGIQPTVLKLVGPDKFQPAYVEWVTNLEMNLANVGYRWFLDSPLLTSPMNVYITYNSVSTLDDFENMERGQFPDHSYVYMGTTSLYPGLAPKGKQIVYACMSCLGDPSVNIAPYLEQVKKIAVKMQPDILDHIEREETFGPLEVSKMGRDSVLPGRGGEDYGVALSTAQYGDKRLNGKTPVAGLYYVGGDAGGFGLGTHQAVDSAVNVSEMVLDYHRTLKAKTEREHS